MSVDLFRKITRSHHRQVQDLIDKGADVVKARDAMGNTLLMRSCSSSLETVKVLVNAGVEVDAVNNSGENALHKACDALRPDVVELLLSLPVGTTLMRRRDTFNEFPIHKAVRDNNTDCLALLLTGGSPLNDRNNNGDTPLHIAARMQHNQHLLLLLKRGGDPTITDRVGKVATDYVSASSPEYQEILIVAEKARNALRHGPAIETLDI